MASRSQNIRGLLCRDCPIWPLVFRSCFLCTSPRSVALTRPSPPGCLAAPSKDYSHGQARLCVAFFSLPSGADSGPRPTRLEGSGDGPSRKSWATSKSCCGDRMANELLHRQSQSSQRLFNPNDRDALERFEDQQVVVASDDCVGSGTDRRRQDFQVFRISQQGNIG